MQQILRAEPGLTIAVRPDRCGGTSATIDGLRACGRLAASAALAALLAGCRVGPDFHRPAPPEVPSYTSAPATPDLTPGADEPAQRLIADQSIPAAWWKLFRSPPLDTVVRQALAGSPTIAAARSRLASAQQAVLEARGADDPQVDAAASAERLKGPPFALGTTVHHFLPTYNLYTVGATVSFVPDVFGLSARRVEQQQALAQNRAYQLTATQLAVTGNAVDQALIIASAWRRTRALEAAVTADEKILALARHEFADGKIARTDVLAAESRLENDRALLPPVRQHVAAAQDALAILLGRPPAAFLPPAFDLADFTLPSELPVSLPSTLVERRPDILAAEARLHAASAAVGVADAQMYPNFTLSASGGMAALATSSLGESSNLIWTLLGGLTAPIFHGGALSAQKRAAIDQFQAELATYRQTVLEGLGQVADLLRSLGHDAEQVRAERLALDAAGRTLDLQRRRHAAGKTGLLPLLDAERRLERQRDAYTAAKALRYLDSARLFVALGGGWWQNAQTRPQPGGPAATRHVSDAASGLP
ncbi:MAG: efflux transporter outer membrane subunit [Gammaproteobacteria bacterium]|nr:efflux transporter outer membrane subunit [Gammaproteobacteria bacterium]